MKPALALLLLPLLAQAQSVVYKCPGPPVLYTDAISAKEAESKGCKPVEGAPVSVVQALRRAAAPAAPVRSESPRASESGRIDPGVQKQRDNDRRSVLETELRQAESRLAELRREYADGNPERLGSERNYARFQERVSELKAALSRQEADVAALKRELAKLN